MLALASTSLGGETERHRPPFAVRHKEMPYVSRWTSPTFYHMSHWGTVISATINNGDVEIFVILAGCVRTARTVVDAVAPMVKLFPLEGDPLGLSQQLLWIVQIPRDVVIRSSTRFGRTFHDRNHEGERSLVRP